MFKKLKEKWKVSNFQLFLILSTFALGGSLCGKIARQLTQWLVSNDSMFDGILLVFFMTLSWPICVLLISIPLGQFTFFKNYIKRITQKFKLGKQPVSVAIFASGAGSNAEKIIQYFRNATDIKIALIVCNKPEAGVLKIASREGIPTLLIERDRFLKGDGYTGVLLHHKIDFIVLAGFLWKIPSTLIQQYPQKIINIHPALLPKFGGKGMYGHHVHQAVITQKEKESGITIHYVDEHYDHGDTIFQATCPVLENDSPDSLAARIHGLEHQYFPEVIGRTIRTSWKR